MYFLRFSIIICIQVLLIASGCQAQTPNDSVARDTVDGAESVPVQEVNANSFDAPDFQKFTPSRVIYQYGPSGIGYGQAEDHLVNILAQNNYDTIFGREPDGQKIFLPELIAGGHFDPETQTWMSLPSNRPIELGFIRGRAKDFPAYYAGRYVVTWEGDGDLLFRLGDPATFRRVGRNRIELSFGPDETNWTRILLSRIGAEGIRNIKIFRAEEEENVNGGYIFSERFRNLVSQYDLVRTMDMNSTNNSWIRNVEQIAPMSWFTWGSSNAQLYPASVPRGFPLEANVRLAQETNTALWLNVPPMLGTPDIFDQPNYFEQVSVPGPNGSVAILRERVASHGQQILASRAMDDYADALVQALGRQGYPGDRHLYLELGNEIWNFGRSFRKSTQYFLGIGDYLSTQQDRTANLRYAYGYMSARFADSFERALDRAGRSQEWTIVLGTQTAVPNRTASIIDGLEGYYRADENNQATVRSKLARFGLATTSYFSGGFSFNRAGNMYNAPTREVWASRFLAEMQRNPQGLRNRIRDWILNGPAVGFTKAWVLEQKAAHRAIANERGVQYLGDYEGGDHDTLGPALRGNADVLRFYNDFRSSPQAAAIRNGVDDAIANAFAGTIHSDYTRIYAFDPRRARPPWTEHMWGEVTPLRRVIEDRLRADASADLTEE